MADNTGAEYQLNARGTVFSQLHDRMCEVFENGDQQESERLARELLGYADLGDYHKAKCHFILSLGSDEYVWHAEQAVELYENMFVVRPGSSHIGETTSEATVKSVKEHLAQAKKFLAKAKEDHAAVQEDYDRQWAEYISYHGRDPTDEELVDAHLEKRCAGANVYAEQYAEKMEEYLQASLPEDDPAADDDEDDLPFIPPPTPPGSFQKDGKGLGYFGDDDDDATTLTSSQAAELK